MKAKIDYLEKTVTCQAERLIDLENRSRRNNLLVFGVEEQHKESEADLRKVVVNEIFGKRLGIEVKSIERIHRIGRKDAARCRPIIMKFYDSREKESVLHHCKKLKGSSISISNDYAQETVAVRKKLWESAAADRANGKKTTLLGDKIKIDEQLYAWDTVQNERCPYQYRPYKSHGSTSSKPGSSRHSTRNKPPQA